MSSIFNIFKDSSKIIEGDVVDLKYLDEVDERSAYDGIPTIYYAILLHGTNTRIGSIDLRLKMNDYMYYYGHIGYDIDKKYRGHNYSYYACLLLFKIAKEKYGLDELYLTCNPENIASYKILKKLKGELVEVAEVPKTHELYGRGDKYKCIFRYKIKIGRI